MIKNTCWAGFLDMVSQAVVQKNWSLNDVFFADTVLYICQPLVNKKKEAYRFCSSFK